VADVSTIAYDALKAAAEHALKKIREGKRLSAEEILVLYLGTIVSDIREIRAEIGRTNQRVDDLAKSLSARIDETNRRIDEIAKSLSARIDELARRIDVVQAALLGRIDELARRVDVVQTTLLEMQKLMVELVKRSG